MNPMLQRHCAKLIYIVPDGLRELMSDISREVIRSQPEQIYAFIADYLDALMITRENARIASRLIDSICEITETTVKILIRVGLTRPEADAVCEIIQSAFKNYLERKKIIKQLEGKASDKIEDDSEEITRQILSKLKLDPEKLNEIARIIQNAWRKFKEKQSKEKDLLFGVVDWRIAARSAIALYKSTGVSKYEANRAATLIKAAYKGYYTRRIMKRLLERGLADEAAFESPFEEGSVPSVEATEVSMAIDESLAISATITEEEETEESSIQEEEIGQQPASFDYSISILEYSGEGEDVNYKSIGLLKSFQDPTEIQKRNTLGSKGPNIDFEDTNENKMGEEEITYFGE